MTDSRSSLRSISAAMLGVIMVLGACSQGGETRGQGASAPPDVQTSPSAVAASSTVTTTTGTEVTKDQARWTLPTDPYYGGHTMPLSFQAIGVVTKNCMEKAGFSDFTVGTDASAPGPANLAGDGVSVFFNEDTASKFGYRLAPNPRNTGGGASATGAPYGDKSDEYRSQLDACNLEGRAAMAGVSVDELAKSAESGSVIEVDNMDIDSQVTGIKNDMSSPELSAAAASWRECMAPLGISDLPDQPWDAASMQLPKSLQNKWSWEPTGTPSADEIATASADAACRASSGWTDTLYQQEWDILQSFVDTHRSELEPILTKYQILDARAREIIARGGA